LATNRRTKRSLGLQPVHVTGGVLLHRDLGCTVQGSLFDGPDARRLRARHRAGHTAVTLSRCVQSLVKILCICKGAPRPRELPGRSPTSSRH